MMTPLYQDMLKKKPEPAKKKTGFAPGFESTPFGQAVTKAAPVQGKAKPKAGPPAPKPAPVRRDSIEWAMEQFDQARPGDPSRGLVKSYLWARAGGPKGKFDKYLSDAIMLSRDLNSNDQAMRARAKSVMDRRVEGYRKANAQAYGPAYERLADEGRKHDLQLDDFVSKGLGIKDEYRHPDLLKMSPEDADFWDRVGVTPWELHDALQSGSPVVRGFRDNQPVKTVDVGQQFLQYHTETKGAKSAKAQVMSAANTPAMLGLISPIGKRPIPDRPLTRAEKAMRTKVEATSQAYQPSLADTQRTQDPLMDIRAQKRVKAMQNLAKVSGQPRKPVLPGSVPTTGVGMVPPADVQIEQKTKIESDIEKDPQGIEAKMAEYDEAIFGERTYGFKPDIVSNHSWKRREDKKEYLSGQKQKEDERYRYVNYATDEERRANRNPVAGAVIDKVGEVIEGTAADMDRLTRSMLGGQTLPERIQNIPVGEDETLRRVAKGVFQTGASIVDPGTIVRQANVGEAMDSMTDMAGRLMSGKLTPEEYGSLLAMGAVPAVAKLSKSKPSKVKPSQQVARPKRTSQQKATFQIPKEGDLEFAPTGAVDISKLQKAPSKISQALTAKPAGAFKERKDVNGIRVTTESVSPKDIGVHEKMQFKTKGIRQDSKTEKWVDEVQNWDPVSAGVITVWEDKTGARYVMNGHHRLKIAKNLNVEDMLAHVYRESDGVTLDDARGYAAWQNLLEGKGSATDHATIMKILDMDEATMVAKGAPLKSGLSRDAYALQRLSPEAWEYVENNKVAEPIAIGIGRILGDDPVRQRIAMQKLSGTEKLRSVAEAEEYARQLERLPLTKKQGSDQGSMFDDVFDDDIPLEEMGILGAAAKDSIRREAAALLRPNKGKAVGKTVIDEVAQKEAAEVAKLADLVLKDGEYIKALEEESYRYRETPTNAQREKSVNRLSELAGKLGAEKWGGRRNGKNVSGGKVQPARKADQPDNRAQPKDGKPKPTSKPKPAPKVKPAADVKGPRFYQNLSDKDVVRLVKEKDPRAVTEALKRSKDAGFRSPTMWQDSVDIKWRQERDAAKPKPEASPTSQPPAPTKPESAPKNVSEPARQKQPWEMTKEELRDLSDTFEPEFTRYQLDWGQPQGQGKRVGGGQVVGSMADPPSGKKTYRDYVSHLDLTQAQRDELRPMQVTDALELTVYLKHRAAGLGHDDAIGIAYDYDTGHRQIIEKALKEGKPVPAKVLAEYPDLAKQYGAAKDPNPPDSKAEKPSVDRPAEGYGNPYLGEVNAARKALDDVNRAKKSFMRTYKPDGGDHLAKLKIDSSLSKAKQRLRDAVDVANKRQQEIGAKPIKAPAPGKTVPEKAAQQTQVAPSPNPKGPNGTGVAAVEGKRFKGDAQEVVEAYEKLVAGGGNVWVSTHTKVTKLARPGLLKAGKSGELMIPEGREGGPWVSLTDPIEQQVRRQVGVDASPEWVAERRQRVQDFASKYIAKREAESVAKSEKQLKGLEAVIADVEQILSTKKTLDGKPVSEKDLKTLAKDLNQLKVQASEIKADMRIEKKPAPKVEDFGEYIPGARKETSSARGSEFKEKPQEKPKYNFEVSEIVSGPSKGKFTIRDRRDKGGLSYRRTLEFATREEAERAIPLYEVSQKHSAAQIAEGEWGISRKVGDKRFFIKKGFASREAAMEYMARNPDEILQYKAKRFDEFDYLEDVKRIGPDRRQGSVTTKAFQDEFGFRGGQFGKWNMKEHGQVSLDHAYDAFYDLVELLDIAPKAVSLDGQLAMAFGARGQGATGWSSTVARAHYEPGEKVINLTREKGAGAVAHEWMHALDHYMTTRFGIQRGHSAMGYRFKEEHGKLGKAWANLREAILTKEHVTSAEDMRSMGQAQFERVNREVGESLDSIRKELSSEQQYGRYNRKKNEWTPRRAADKNELAAFDDLAGRIRKGDVGQLVNVDGKSTTSRFTSRLAHPEVIEIDRIYKKVKGRSILVENGDGYKLSALIGRAKKMAASAESASQSTRRVTSNYKLAARNADKSRASSYYELDEEMLARAFQSYLHDKMKSEGRVSQYLNTGGREVPFFDDVGGEVYLFPTGAERKAIHAAFDEVFDALREDFGAYGSRQSPSAPVQSKPEPQGALGRKPVSDLGQVLVFKNPQTSFEPAILDRGATRLSEGLYQIANTTEGRHVIKATASTIDVAATREANRLANRKLGITDAVDDGLFGGGGGVAAKSAKSLEEEQLDLFASGKSPSMESGAKQTLPIPVKKPATPWQGGTLADITNEFRQVTGLQTRAGLGRARGGQYDPQSGMTSVNVSTDLNVFAHEVAHALDDQFDVLGSDRARKFDKNNPLDQELKRFWTSGYSSASPRKSIAYNRAEGWAEFLRHTFRNPDEAARIAPNLTKLFNAKVPSKVIKQIHATGKKWQAWYHSSDLQKMEAARQFESPKKPSGLAQVKASVVLGKRPKVGYETSTADKAKMLFTNDLAPVEAAVYEAMRRQGIKYLRPSEDPVMLMQNYKYIPEKVDSLLSYGMTDIDGKLVTGPAHTIFDQLDRSSADVFMQEYRDAMKLMDSERTVDIAQKLMDDALESVLNLDQRLTQKLEDDIQSTVKKIADEHAVSMASEIATIKGRYQERMRTASSAEQKSLMAESDAKIAGIKKKYADIIQSKSSQVIQELKDVKSATVASAMARALKRAERQSARLTGAGGGEFSATKVAKGAIPELQSNPERYARLLMTAAKMRQWTDATLKYAVQAGRFTPDQYKAIKKNNQYYSVWQRVFEEAEMPNFSDFAGRKIGNAKDPIKRREGSERMLANPLQSMLENTYKLIAEADRNEAMQRLTDLLSTNRKMGEGPQIDLASIGHKVKPGDYPNAVRVWRTVEHVDSVTGLKSYEQVLEHWKFEAGLEDALKGLTEPKVTNVKMFEYSSKLNTVWGNFIIKHPAFQVRNKVRDMQQTLLNTSADIKASDWTPKISSKESQEYGFFGGGIGHENYFTAEMDFDAAQKKVLSMAQTDGKTVVLDGRMPISSARALAARMGEKWEHVIQWNEQSTRMAVVRAKYREAVKNGYSERDAKLFAHAAARNVMDFKSGGRYTRWFSRYIARFTNAQVQGMRSAALAKAEAFGLGWRPGRAILPNSPTGKSVKRYLLRQAMVSIIPAVIHYLWVRDDEERLRQYNQEPAALRDTAYSMPVPELGITIRVPKAFDDAMISSGVQRLAAQILDGDEKAWEGFGESVYKSTKVIDEQSTLPQAAQWYWEQRFNENIFTGASIISFGEEDMPLELRKGQSRASRLGQELGKVFKVDARRIDHLIRSIFGYYGSDLMMVSDISRKDKPPIGPGIAKSATGMVSESPGMNARDVRWVMDMARKYAGTNPFSGIQDQLNKAEGKHRQGLKDELLRLAIDMRKNLEVRLKGEKDEVRRQYIVRAVLNSSPGRKTRSSGGRVRVPGQSPKQMLRKSMGGKSLVPGLR